MDPSLLCRLFFSLWTAAVLAGTLLPASFKQRIMNYGARGIRTPDEKKEERAQKGPASQVIEYLQEGLQVPRAWFTHYYVVSVASSIFWAVQIITNGRAFQFLAANADYHSGGTMTVNQVVLAWSLMAAQGLRRLYECLALEKPSQSRMWIGIWLLGILYYLVMGVSVWIEGIGALTQKDPLASHLDYSAPSLKTAIAVPLFIAGSLMQNHCHRKLASLKKYTFPEGLFFNSIVSPHYTSECLVYIAIGIVAAPMGQIFNQTVLAGLVFVVCNLGITANTTRIWYIEKFGADKVVGRWRLIPILY